MTNCVARRFNPKHILGLDLDKSLVDRALRKLNTAKSKRAVKEEHENTTPNGVEDEVVSDNIKKEKEAEEVEDDEENKSDQQSRYPANVDFRHVDFLEAKTLPDERYDVILWYAQLC